MSRIFPGPDPVTNYPHPTNAPRAALPAEVAAALIGLGHFIHKEDEAHARETIRAHLHHLTAEVERLRAEVKLLSADSPDAAAWLLSETADRARLDALRWVCSQAMCADWHDLGERIKAEIARLESNA